MKVALLSYLFDRLSGGGAPRSAYFLAKGLVAAGVDVTVITTHDGADDVVEDRGLRIHRLHPRNLYWVGTQDDRGTLQKAAWQLVDFWNPFVYRATLGILRREAPQIVHVQKLRGLSPSVWRAARQADGAALVQTCRDYELFSPQAMLDGRVGRMAGQGSPLLAPYRMARARMSAQVDAAVTPSRFTMEMLLERGFFPNASHTVIPNTPGFTDAELRALANRSARPSGETGLRVLYLGRLEEIKGVGDICEVVGELSKTRTQIHLDVIGGGSAAPRLKSRFGASPRIRFHGVLHGQAKERLIAAASVVAVPSRWPEVFGNVIPEAYSFGKPVIGARTGGIPELIDEGRTGFLFEPGDKEEMQLHLEAFLRDPDLSARLRPACLKAARRFTIDATAAAHLSLYQRLLTRSVE